ncbi:MAG TPA: xanthine dehydrogenase family protein subunit M [Burkholderiales bacterium]
MSDYARPTRLREALQLLARSPRPVLAGGTDFYPARVGRALPPEVLDITGLQELRGIVARATHWRIGARTTWSELLAARLPPLFDGLRLAAREVGGVQIQNAGTIAGNLCNASPAADGVPALLALDAQVEIARADGQRRLPLGEFILGPRKTALRPGELVTALLVPRPKSPAASHVLKLGARRYLVISIAMASAVIEHKAGKVKAARVAVGSCSPVAVRLAALETDLRGQRFDATLADRVQARHFATLAPIADVRASAEYRTQAALELVRRLLRELA